MIRCTKLDENNNIVEVPSAGVYKIGLYTMHHPEEFKHQIQTHAPVWVDAGAATARVVDDGPAISNKTPFEGEICVHELEWLEKSIPGTTYPKNYEFTWEKVGK